MGFEREIPRRAISISSLPVIGEGFGKSEASLDEVIGPNREVLVYDCATFRKTVFAYSAGRICDGRIGTVDGSCGGTYQ